jgi:uncharacterized protein (DUF362 family)
MPKSRVAVLKVKPQSILEDVDRVCELAGMSGELDAGRTTILSGSLASNRPFPASCTTPWQLEGTILALERAGFGDITCVRSEPPSRGSRGADPNGLEPILRRYGVPVLDNLEPDDMRWVEYRPRANLHVLHRIFPDGIRLPDYFFGKNIVHLPTVRCSALTTTTGAMECGLGGLLGARRHLVLADVQRVLVDLLAIQKEIHGGLFALMDGTTAGNGPGPRAMVPVVKDYLLASSDQVAIDAVAAKMMGFDPLGLEFVRVAHEDGLGVGDPRDIEIVGDDVSNQSWGFSAGDDPVSSFGGLLRLGPLQKLLLHTPLAHLLSAGGDAYPDSHRWRPEQTAAFELWKAQTDWGKLFTRYERGPLRR